MKIIKYETGIDNFYMFVSHQNDGTVGLSYMLINEEDNVGVEIIPKYGPLTILEQENLTEAYLNRDIKTRGNWSQLAFDDNDFNTLLSNGEFELIVSLLKERL